MGNVCSIISLIFKTWFEGKALRKFKTNISRCNVVITTLWIFLLRGKWILQRWNCNNPYEICSWSGRFLQRLQKGWPPRKHNLSPVVFFDMVEKLFHVVNWFFKLHDNKWCQESGGVWKQQNHAGNGPYYRQVVSSRKWRQLWEPKNMNFPSLENKGENCDTSSSYHTGLFFPSKKSHGSKNKVKVVNRWPGDTVLVYVIIFLWKCFFT